MAKVNYSNNTE